MRILVLGRTGQLAQSLLERSAMAPNVEVTALGRPQLDLEDASQLEDALKALRPDIVINAAAYTAVDKAEQDTQRVFAVNCQGAGNAAVAAAKQGLPFIHLSTDYVYSGHKTSPYEEGDETGPLGVYGHSKLLGEMRVMDEHPSPLILRTSWVYSPFGTNFVKTMLRIGAEKPVLNVVDDQIGNPTSALDLASAILRIAPGLTSGGTYHLSGTGDATWCDFAREIFVVSEAHGGPAPAVHAITTAQFPTPAKRPANSRLSTNAFAKRFGFRLGSWQAELEPVVKRLLAAGE
jgi:dTDP-4-dehydrorhamnose reductase